MIIPMLDISIVQCNQFYVLESSTVVTEMVMTSLTLRLLMSYIYMEHPFLMFLDHTRRRSTVGRTPLDE